MILLYENKILDSMRFRLIDLEKSRYFIGKFSFIEDYIWKENNEKHISSTKIGLNKIERFK